MDALLTAIVVWLSTNFGLPMDFEQPHIERVASVEMATLRHRGLWPSRQREAAVISGSTGSDVAAREVVAVYNDETATIYLASDWQGRTPAELSVLVHEMAHHLQARAGTKYECSAQHEKLAYEAQEKWLDLFGRSLESEFRIDGFALLISTSCAMAILP